MKKLLAFLTACIALTSCSNVGNNSGSQNADNSVTDEISADPNADPVSNGYKSDELSMPDGCMDIYDIITFPDSDKVCLYCSMGFDKPAKWFETTKEFADFTEILYQHPEGWDTADFASELLLFNNDQSFFSFITLEDHGGMKLPEQYDENYDYDTYNANCTTQYLLCKYDSNKELKSTVPLEFPDEFFDSYGYLYFSDFIADGDSLLLSDDHGKIHRISENGEITQIFSLEGTIQEVMAPSFYRDLDGNVVIGIRDFNSDGIETLSLCHLEEDYSVNEPFYNFENFYDAGNITSGSGKYLLYISKYDALYGITENGELEMIYEYEDAGVSMGITINTGENEFVSAVDSSTTGDDGTLFKIYPRDPDEGINLIEISIGGPIGTPSEIINKFNKSQDKYKVRSVNFAQSDDDYYYDDSAENANLNLAILSGDAPDIIMGLSDSTYQNYRKKGLFVDLYPLMENDPNVNKNTILPNYLKAMESSDGSLYGISSKFSVMTMIAKTRVCDKESWTLDDMIALYENPPVNAIHRYDAYNKDETFSALFYCMNDFIDYETATCNFDSPEFIKMLEFCNRFTSEVDKPDKANEGAYAVQNYWTDRSTWLANDYILTEDQSPLSYNYVKYLEAGSEELTFVGFPSSNGKGGKLLPSYLISINKECECKEGAWEFVSYYMENSNSAGGDYGTPVLTEKFEEAMDSLMTQNATASGREIPNFTQEERDMVSAYIKRCDSLSGTIDYNIETVCMEEAGLYFAGEQTVEQAAEHIQNRVSIIISEKS